MPDPSPDPSPRKGMSVVQVALNALPSAQPRHMPIIRGTTFMTLAVRHTCHAYGSGPASAHACTNAVAASSAAKYRNWRAADASTEHLRRETAAQSVGKFALSTPRQRQRQAQGGLRQPRPASANQRCLVRAGVFT